MRKMAASAALIIWLQTTSAQAGTSTAAHQQSLTVGQEETTGQAASAGEQAAWQKVDEIKAIKKKSLAAQDYLKQFPGGAYVAYAHEIIAVFYRQENDLARFFEHAEEALEGLPFQAALRVELCVGYAENEKPDLAIIHGERALSTLTTVGLSAQESEPEWNKRREALTGEAHYGVGTAYLFKAFQTRNKGQLGLAAEHLRKAVEINPRDERSHFRLAFASQMQKKPEEAIREFARAVALEGANAPMAMQYLERVYQAVHGHQDGLKELIAEQKRYLETKSGGIP